MSLNDVPRLKNVREGAGFGKRTCPVFRLIVNVATLTITPAQITEPGNGRRASRRGGSGNGDGGAGGNGTGGSRGHDGPPQPDGIKMPDIVKVKEGDENWQRHEFDDRTACMIVEDAEGEGDEEQSVYTFYIGVDNIYLKTDMKGTGDDAALVEAKFVYANVLVGLALIHDERNRNRTRQEEHGDSREVPIEETVNQTTRAMAPFLVPMIDYLGALSSDDVAGLAQIGDED